MNVRLFKDKEGDLDAQILFITEQLQMETQRFKAYDSGPSENNTFYWNRNTEKQNNCW